MDQWMRRLLNMVCIDRHWTDREFEELAYKADQQEQVKNDGYHVIISQVLINGIIAQMSRSWLWYWQFYLSSIGRESQSFHLCM